MTENKKAAALDMFVKITQSSIFTSGEGSEQIQRTLRYNVHKNLGECYMEEENWTEAEDHFFLATQIDRTDVTLWWQLGKLNLMPHAIIPANIFLINFEFHDLFFQPRHL